jgi:protein-S-isoprenylcysteine O-methyltransferase Ste14
MKTMMITLRAVLYMTAFLLFFAWLALRVHALDRSLNLSLPGGCKAVGAVFMVAGGILGLICAGVFVARGRGTPALFDAPREFVAVGPYRYCRNPMYIGGLLLLIGFGLYERSVSILIMAAVLWGVVHLLVVFYEEPTLTKSFGSPYEQYCQDVRRWIPRRRRGAA